jgi:hypothetical protein
MEAKDFQPDLIKVIYMTTVMRNPPVGVLCGPWVSVLLPTKTRHKGRVKTVADGLSCITFWLTGKIDESENLRWQPSQRGLNGSDSRPASDPTPIDLSIWAIWSSIDNRIYDLFLQRFHHLANSRQASASFWVFPRTITSTLALFRFNLFYNC